MVLDSELKVCERNRDECRYNDKNDKHNEQNAVDCVDFVPPYAGENVEELDVYSTKWKKACHTHLEITNARRNSEFERNL
jgi:hypothetical protein